MTERFFDTVETAGLRIEIINEDGIARSVEPQSKKFEQVIITISIERAEGVIFTRTVLEFRSKRC